MKNIRISLITVLQHFGWQTSSGPANAAPGGKAAQNAYAEAHQEIAKAGAGSAARLAVQGKNMELSFIAMISHASLVAKVVLALLVLMSIASWAVMIQKFFSLGAARSRALRGTRRFDAAANLRDAVTGLGEDPKSPLYGIAHCGVQEFNRSRELGNASEVVVDNVRRALHQGAASEMAAMQKGLPFLATTANTAPFIGLFGTVWGIMNSFHSIGLSKSASLATVAPGISEALVATAIGLAVAVPATIGYNLFMGRLGQLDTLLVNFAGFFLNRVQREINAQRPAQRSGATEL